MPTWKQHRGEDALYEGTVTFSTVVGATASPYNLAGATLTWHMGSVLATPMITRSSAGGTNFSFGTAIGTYTFSLSDVDTELLAATTYYWDMWLTTTGGNEYCLTVGTLNLMGVVGTL